MLCSDNGNVRCSDDSNVTVQELQHFPNKRERAVEHNVWFIDQKSLPYRCVPRFARKSECGRLASAGISCSTVRVSAQSAGCKHSCSTDTPHAALQSCTKCVCVCVAALSFVNTLAHQTHLHATKKYTKTFVWLLAVS